MSYDLNILCIKQKEVSLTLPEGVCIYAKPKKLRRYRDHEIYKKYFSCRDALDGMWYYLMENEDEISSFELCDIKTMEDEYVDKLYPFWYKKEDDIDVSIFSLREKYKKDVLATMHFFIKQSPVNSILFHSRYQTFEVEPEFIYGVLTFQRFIELLESDRILFNTCYIIRD